MNAHSILVSGRWAHFKRPEANNNPITYDIMPKTAFIGLMSAVVGLNRAELKESYESFSKEIFYNIQVVNPIKKIATNFRIYKYKGGLTNIEHPPQFYEILKDPKFRITFYGNSDLVSKFVKSIKNDTAIYTPTLGLANCPADIVYEKRLELEKSTNIPLSTKGIVPMKECNVKLDLKKGYTFTYDKIPAVQNNDWHNIKYKEVFYGYLPEGEYVEVSPSNYENQFQDKKGIGYYFI